MTFPKTYRAFRRSKTPFPRTISISEETLPDTLGSHDVIIRIHAVALNYRDKAMLEEGKYPVPIEDGGISASDCAAEVVGLGDKVTDFVIGDHVAPTINLANLSDADRDADAQPLGGDATGVLREYALFEDKYLVKLPKHISWEEAATIPTAGISAWLALGGLAGLTEGATALLQGTGGVSMYALLICLGAGIKPIITSSSDEKLARIIKLDPRIEGINYRTTPDVTAEVFRLTQGRGVDYVVNNAGLQSIPKDLEALRKYGGIVTVVGFLEGFQPDWKPDILFQLLTKAARLQGILGGSKLDFQALNKFLEEKKVHLASVIDRTFAFEDSPAALDYLWSGAHVGKVVVKIA